MKQKVKLLDVVALTQELPDRELSLGQVGTVVEILAPDVSRWNFQTMKGARLQNLP